MAIGVMPSIPKIYHILHMDRLPFVLADGALWSDAKMAGKPDTGTMIGMDRIKQRRLTHALVCFPWYLISQIGVYSPTVQKRVCNDLSKQVNRPPVVVKKNWYY